MFTLPTPENPVVIIKAEAVTALRGLPPNVFDAVITDPPYSSGGFTRGDRQMGVAEKYQQHGQVKEWDGFGGDNRDARSWAFWCVLWLSEARRTAKPGAYLQMFSDWRQLPSATDVIQAGEWQWRGLISWDKGLGARGPHKGYFRHQCEFIPWGTNGPLPIADTDDPRGGPWPGSYTVQVKHSDKFHLTGKPTPLLRQLVRCVPRGGIILDPFAGSGTTGVAAVLEGRLAVLIEQDAAHVATCHDRTRRAIRALADPDLFGSVDEL